MNRRAARPDPEQARQRLAVAVGHLQRGQLEQGSALLDQLLDAYPDEPSTLQLAGAVALQRGRRTDAIRLIGRALQLNPRLVDAHSNIALAYLGEGRSDDAERHLNRALALRPDFPEALVNLANLYRERSELLRAEPLYRRALALRPSFPEADNNLALVLNDTGRPLEAEQHARRAIAQRPGFAEAYQTLGQVLDTLGRMDEAIAAHRQAVALSPRRARAHADLAATLMAFGRRGEAIDAYRAALELEPRRDEWRRVLGKLDAETTSLADQEARYRDPAATPEQKMHLGFAVGKGLEDAGEYARALPYLLEANALKRATYAYDPGGSEAAFADIAAAFGPELFARHQNAGSPDPTPIFVLGMPRSGTTLIEQILASHPDVFGAGELPLLRDLSNGLGSGEEAAFRFTDILPPLKSAAFTTLGASYVSRLRGYSADARFITDKMPGNFLLIGMIRLALPNARIIHCVRDAADTSISIFKNYFASNLRYAYDLGEIGHYHRLYQRLMQHWHTVLPGFVHDVSYEALVADQEGETRRLLALCGLDFRPECLDFFATQRPVHTASAAQVRSPISNGSIGIARRYGDGLKPLYDALGHDPRP